MLFLIILIYLFLIETYTNEPHLKFRIPITDLHITYIHTQYLYKRSISTTLGDIVVLSDPFLLRLSVKNELAVDLIDRATILNKPAILL